MGWSRASPQSDDSGPNEEHDQALIALRGWWEEWSEIACAVVTRRDYLIRLGLAKKRKGTKKTAAPAPAPAPAQPAAAAMTT